MMRLFYLTVIALVVVAMVVIGDGTPDQSDEMPLGLGASSVWSYVAYDRDTDRQPSVGDEMRWFITADAATTVRLTCWADATKAKQTQTGSLTFPTPLLGYGTPAGITLTTAGYCESVGTTTAGTAVGGDWFPVAP